MARKKRKAVHISDVLSELMARRGFGRVKSTENYEAAWAAAAGELVAQYSRPGQLRRGTLEVVVSHSALIQELGFQKPQILEALNRQLPDQEIKDIRFRSGAIK